MPISTNKIPAKSLKSINSKLLNWKNREMAPKTPTGTRIHFSRPRKDKAGIDQWLLPGEISAINCPSSSNHSRH